tara:strand:+ start:1382 stop:2122 length:741 start_codon:yes stop_codon:yes gene_type:complete
VSARIIVPSYHRAGKTTIRQVVESAAIAVIESEADEYRSLEGGEIIVMPEKVGGNISVTRNWILDYGFEQSERVVMMDDDVTEFGRFEWNSSRAQYDYLKYDQSRMLEFIENGFDMADEAGVKLWGVGVVAAPRAYREYAPFSFLSPVLGPFTCVSNNGLRYDNRLRLNEDYDYFLQQIQKYRRVLRFDSHWYRCNHLTMPGGVTSYRTLDEEYKQAEIMVKKWGPEVVRYNFDKSTNPRIRVPIP